MSARSGGPSGPWDIVSSMFKIIRSLLLHNVCKAIHSHMHRLGATSSVWMTGGLILSRVVRLSAKNASVMQRLARRATVHYYDVINILVAIGPHRFGDGPLGPNRVQTGSI